MLKKLFAISLIFALMLSLVAIPGYAADPPSDKSAYFQDNAAVNCTPKEEGNNVKTLLSGDVLKINVIGKSDPNFNIDLKDNVDTTTYKILALKVKKSVSAKISGEIFYNVKDSGAVGGNSITFEYKEGTDYQWVYVDLSTKSVSQVGFIRYDVFTESPTDNEYLTLACVGFFKSVDDMNAFASSDTGKTLGTNEGDKYFAVSMAGPLAGPGIWLNSVKDNTKPGHYWVKFNAALPFKSINIMLYAKNGTGKWALYKYDTDFDKTMAGTPVATQTISQAGDGAYTISFANQMAKGQYVLYIEQDTKADTYFNVGTTSNKPNDKKFEFGYNGTPFGETPREMIFATIDFIGDPVGAYADLIPDGTQTNPQTGDISLIGFAAMPLIAVLSKKRKVK